MKIRNGKDKINEDSMENKNPLRLEAEKRAYEQTKSFEPSYDIISNETYDKIIHELTVHQFELQVQNEELQRIQHELEVSQKRYFDLYELAPVGYLLVNTQGIILEVNLTLAKLCGLPKNQMINRSIETFIAKEDQDVFYLFMKKLHGADSMKVCELKMRNDQGEVFWGRIEVNMINDETPLYRMILSDITLRKQLEIETLVSAEKYKLIYAAMKEGLALFDVKRDEKGNPIDYVFLDINRSYSKLLGITWEAAIGESYMEVMSKSQRKWMRYFSDVVQKKGSTSRENFDETSGKYFATSYFVTDENTCAMLISDISQRIERESLINHMNYHDTLTDLYNRRFFEEELKRMDTKRNLPLTIVMGDINGLKLINDSFGHAKGDELIKLVAKVLKEECRDDDIIARISGDEFILLLPKADTEETEKIIWRIKSASKKYKIESIGISISFGYETKFDMSQDTSSLYKSAENHMYRNKLYESASVKSNMIDVIMRTLFEKNKRESLHSSRVSDISLKIAEAMNLSDEDISHIGVAGLMHDIGKIGIDEKVLNSQEKLSEEEWYEIQRHSEIGYRILSTTNDFADIADVVLQHHERWDGQGYPKGLAGQEISLSSRIIMIADTYDAMTRERTYKTKMSQEEARSEFIRCSGSQFDPEVVDVFLNGVFDELVTNDTD